MNTEMQYRAMVARQAVEEGRPLVISRLALGNRTALDIVLLPLDGRVGYLPGTDDTYVYVSVPGSGGWAFRRGSFVHWSYVIEKLDLLGSDAKAVADFLNAAIGEAVTA